MASKHNTIMDALVTKLATITAGSAPIVGGAAYVYTPHVWRTSRPIQYSGLPLTLESGKTAIVLVAASSDKSTLLTGCNDQRHALQIVLLCAVPLEVPSERPWESDYERASRSADIVADVMLCLHSDLKISGNFLRSITESFEVEYELYNPKWALAEIRVTASYQHEKDERA